MFKMHFFIEGMLVDVLTLRTVWFKVCVCVSVKNVLCVK